MSLNEGRAERLNGLRRGVLLIVAAVAIVIASFIMAGALGAAYALAGFAIGAAAAFVAMRSGNERVRLAPPLAVSERTNDPLRAIVSGLPDPVIALDRDWRVLALNEPARALAPALRQGEPVSLALRMPELIEAVGRAFARTQEQRFEYSERVPVDRWFEVVVMPVGRAPDPVKPDLVLLTFHDLTPLHRVEEMRADFIANASHELRTPLAAVSGFIETLQGSARDDAKARERFLAIMQQQA
jgi:two-component system phosphate regulon sensor histidine kinase PhoR